MKCTGFKKALFKLEDKATRIEVIDVGMEYLEKLKTVTGQPILQHRRKTLVLGFITALSSLKRQAMYLLSRHLRIRGKNEFNNNQDMRQLKSALKKMGIHFSIKTV